MFAECRLAKTYTCWLFFILIIETHSYLPTCERCWRSTAVIVNSVFKSGQMGMGFPSAYFIPNGHRQHTANLSRQPDNTWWCCLFSIWSYRWNGILRHSNFLLVSLQIIKAWANAHTKTSFRNLLNKNRWLASQASFDRWGHLDVLSPGRGNRHKILAANNSSANIILYSD